MIRTSTQHETEHALNHSEQTVFVVDDHAEARRGLLDLARSWGCRAEPFESAEAFLGSYDRARPGCVIAREDLPGLSGLALLGRLRAKGMHVPVILVADDPDVRLAVSAMQQGAVSVLPCGASPQELRDTVRRALQVDAEDRRQLTHQRELQRRLARLTPAEIEVLDLMISGKANKNIARHQAVSLRTVETRRQQVFQKMEADSLAELILMVVQAKTGQELPELLLTPRPLSRVE